ncbi:MAG: fasciclin domain-containing protein [Longimicrobiales bacterium]
MWNHRTPLIVAAALALVASPALAQEQQQPQPETIISVLERQGNHTTFLQAIRAAGLEETLQGEGPYTVFAPTDEAFAKLPEGKLDELMANPETLKELLSFHIAAQAIRSADVTEPMNVATLQGSSVQVSKDGETLRVQAPAPAAEVTAEAVVPGATTSAIVTPDLEASNGVIHAVDTVLLIEG